MSSFRVRPRFEHTIDLRLDDARDRLLRSLSQQPLKFEVKAFDGFISLHMAEQERRLWSPRLALTLQATSDRTTLIQGTYGPNADLWSIFLYGYLISGSLGIFSGIFGIAQLSTEDYPWGLWVLGSMGAVAILLYLGAQLGQKLAAWQTFLLHQAYQTAIDRPTEIR